MLNNIFLNLIKASSLLCFFLHFIEPQCIPSQLFSCLQCQSHYYDRNFLIDFSLPSNLKSSSDCQPKTSLTFNHKILVTNLPSCQNEILTGYNDCYTSALTAFQAENRKIISFSKSTLEFDFAIGDHYLLKRDLEFADETLFRQSNSNIFLRPKKQNDIVNVYIKTNEFYFFISGNFTVENLNFNVRDLEILNINDTNACYNSVSQLCCPNGCDVNPPNLKNMTNTNNYGFFTIEGIFGETENFANLIIKNSNFNGFKPIYLQYGWVRFIVVGVNGNLIINGSLFEDFYMAGGFLDFSFGSYDRITGFLNNGTFNNDSQLLLLTNSEFRKINQLGFENLGFFRIEAGSNIFFMTENSVFKQIYSVKCVFCLENTWNFKIINVSFELCNTTIIFQIANIKEVYFYFIKLINIININQPLFSFQNSAYKIAIENIFLQNSNLFQVFLILNVSNFVLTHNIYTNISLYDSFIRSDSSTINLTNNTLYMISCQNALFFLQQSSYSLISNSSFSFLQNFYTLFMITGYKTFEISNVLIQFTNSYNTFLLTNTFLSLINFLQISNSSFTNIFSYDHSCFNTTMISCAIENNNISSKIIALFTVPNIIFSMNGCYVSNNNLTQIYLMKIIVGFAFLDGTVFRNIFFLNTKNYQYCFDFESANIATITSCVFEDIGVIEIKKYYLATSNNGMLNLWQIKSASVQDSVFVVGKQIDLASGFITGVPLGNYFYSVRNTFIIWDATNNGFKYKGIMIDHALLTVFMGNRFFNLLCNTMDFYHMLGAVLITAGTSFSYSKNNYKLVMINNTFVNCFCMRAGALAIISISETLMFNNSFFNNTAPLYGGHLLVVSGDLLNISQISLSTSSSDGDAGALFLQNFLMIKITKLTICTQPYCR